MGYWDTPEQCAEPLSRETVSEFLDKMKEDFSRQYCQPDIIILHPDQYEFFCFVVAMSKSPTHPFIVLLRRLYTRARGRAKFKTLLRYARDATGFTEDISCLM